VDASPLTIIDKERKRQLPYKPYPAVMADEDAIDTLFFMDSLIFKKV
jgi:hypothetical protein